MKLCNLSNGKTLIIREARKEDAGNCIDYLNKVSVETDYLTFGKGEMTTSKTEQENIIEGSAKADNHLMLLAILENRIVGVLNFRGGLRPRIKHTGEFGLTILQDYWGLGIGQELLMYLVDWANASQLIRKINLWVRTDNDRAIKLYTKMGFIKDGMSTREFLIYGKFYDSYLMGMEIN